MVRQKEPENRDRLHSLFPDLPITVALFPSFLKTPEVQKLIRQIRKEIKELRSKNEEAPETWITFFDKTEMRINYLKRCIEYRHMKAVTDTIRQSIPETVETFDKISYQINKLDELIDKFDKEDEGCMRYGGEYFVR